MWQPRWTENAITKLIPERAKSLKRCRCIEIKTQWKLLRNYPHVKALSTDDSTGKFDWKHQRSDNLNGI